MSRFALAGSTALATLMAASAAHADVTAEDVWQNIRAYVETLGGELSVETAKSGNRLTVGEISLTWNVPFAEGKVTLRETGFELIENGDGTVSFVYPDRIEASFSGEAMEKPPFSFAIEALHEGLVFTASGSPGDVTYTYAADNMTLSLADMAFKGSDQIDLDFDVTVNGVKGESRVTVTNVVTSVGSSTAENQSFDAKIITPDDGRMAISGKAGDTRSDYTVTLPRNGMDILNLAAAFRDGLQMHVTSQIRGYETLQLVHAGDELVSEQASTVAVYDTAITLDGTHLQMDVTSKDGTNRVLMPEIFPLPITFDMAAADMLVDLPVSAGEGLQQAAIKLNASGVTVGEELWGLIDPAQTLPRDPMTVRMDLSASVKSYLDWFDFMNVGARMQAGEKPGELHGVALKDLQVEMAGASLTGSGAAEFDNTDLVTFGGFPKPVGSLDMVLKGGNALLDKLIGIGLVKEQDAMGARMMIGMVAKPAPEMGEDVLRSRIEMNGEGHIIANGVRMR